MWKIWHDFKHEREKKRNKHKSVCKGRNTEMCAVTPSGAAFKITHFIYHWLESAFECKDKAGGRSAWCWVGSKTWAGSDAKLCPFCSSGLTWVSSWLCLCTRTSARGTCTEKKEKLQGQKPSLLPSELLLHMKSIMSFTSNPCLWWHLLTCQSVCSAAKCNQEWTGRRRVRHRQDGVVAGGGWGLDFSHSGAVNLKEWRTHKSFTSFWKNVWIETSYLAWGSCMSQPPSAAGEK